MERLFNYFAKFYYKFYYRFIISFLGGEIGRESSICNKLYYRVPKGASVKIGDYFKFNSGGGYNPLARNLRGYIYIQDRNAVLSIGNYVGISSSTLWVSKKITIGNFVNIGADCLIIDSDCHALDWNLRGYRGGFDENGCLVDKINTKSAPVTIEDDVMIGARCIILKGVTIGARSVIGAGSVVSQSIPSDCVAAGNPCKVIRFIKGNK